MGLSGTIRATGNKHGSPYLAKWYKYRMYRISRVHDRYIYIYQKFNGVASETTNIKVGAPPCVECLVKTCFPVNHIPCLLHHRRPTKRLQKPRNLQTRPSIFSVSRDDFPLVFENPGIGSWEDWNQKRLKHLYIFILKGVNSNVSRIVNCPMNKSKLFLFIE